MICTMVLTYYFAINNSALKYKEVNRTKTSTYFSIKRMIDAGQTLRIKELKMIEYPPFNCKKGPSQAAKTQWVMRKNYVNITESED